MNKSVIKTLTYSTLFTTIASIDANATPKSVKFLSTLVTTPYPAVKMSEDGVFTIDIIFGKKPTHNFSRINFKPGSKVLVQDKNDPTKTMDVLTKKYGTVNVGSNQNLKVLTYSKHKLNKDILISSKSDEFFYKTTKLTPNNEFVEKKTSLTFDLTTGQPRITTNKDIKGFLTRTNEQTEYDPLNNNSVIKTQKTIKKHLESTETYYEDQSRIVQTKELHNGKKYISETNKNDLTKINKYSDPSGISSIEEVRQDGSKITHMYQNGVLKVYKESTANSTSEKLYDDNGKLVTDKSSFTLPNGEKIESIVTSSHSRTTQNTSDGLLASFIERTNDDPTIRHVFTSIGGSSPTKQSQ